MPDWNCVGGFGKIAAVTLTRPANTTPYTAEDEVATATTVGAQFQVARESDTTGLITGATLIYSSNPAAAPQFRLLLFSADVTAAGDNSPIALSDAHAATCIGMIDFTTTQAAAAGTSGALICIGAPEAPILFDAAATSNLIYGLLIARQGFTPIANSETITIRLRVEQN